jgi:hypothetical protein
VKQRKVHYAARKKTEEENTAGLIDKLIEFEDFKTNIMPMFRKAVKEKKSASEIYKMAQSMVAARMVTDALIAPRISDRIAAGKEVLDRGVGKAADNININKRFEEMTDEEIEAALRTKREEIADIESDANKH